MRFRGNEKALRIANHSRRLIRNAIIFVGSPLRLIRLILILYAAIVGNLPKQALAQSQTARTSLAYPNKPIRIIVPVEPGGGNDTVARVIAHKLMQTLGWPIVVDNRAGAGGVIGIDMAAKALPDGYTLLMGSVPLSVTGLIKLPYDPVKDFAPISLIGTNIFVLVVHPSIPSTSVAELVALAKAKPLQLNYTSGGIGTPYHLAGELFIRLTGAELTHVPYKGGRSAITAVLSGACQVMFGSVNTTTPLVQAGRLRALAVTSAQRSARLPQLPTVAESGVPGFEITNWNGLLAPTGTPKAIVSKLNSELKSLQKTDMRESLMTQGIDPLDSSPEQFADFLRAEVAKWAKVIKGANIHAD